MEFSRAFPFSRGSSQHMDQIQVSRIAGGFFTSWAIRDAQYHKCGMHTGFWRLSTKKGVDYPSSNFFILICYCSVTRSCSTLCNPMDSSTPGFPVHHHLPEFAQTHVHRVGDAIQPSHPVITFSSCLQSFPASGSFPMSRLVESGGQSIGASVSASVLPMNIQGWFPLGLTGLISLLSKGLQNYSSKASVLQHSAFFIIQLSHSYMSTEKTIALTI